MSSNCASAARNNDCSIYLNRIEAVTKLIQNHIHVVSAGGCMKNNDTVSSLLSHVDRTSLTLFESQLEAHVLEKYLFFRDHIFAFVPENSVCPNGCYISEKLMEAVTSGAIPIYFGCLGFAGEEIFNAERVIMIQSLDDIDRVTQWMSNFSEVSRVQKLPILTKDYKEKILKIENENARAFVRVFENKGIAMDSAFLLTDFGVSGWVNEYINRPWVYEYMGGWWFSEYVSLVGSGVFVILIFFVWNRMRKKRTVA